MSTRALETTLAHHPESEQALIGSLLIAPNALSDVHAVLSPADLYDPKHAAIFESMLRLSDEGHPVELASITTDLRNYGDLDKIGGLAYLLACTKLGSPQSCMYYAQEVLDASTKRRVANFHLSGLHKTNDGTGATGRLLITQAMADLDSLAEERAVSATGSIGDTFDSTLDMIQTMGAADGGVTGLSTGFYDLDRMTYGLHPGQMITVAARPGAGKALALDTPIPTPTGWTTMGDLRPGDQVLGPDGDPTTVRAATPVMTERPCYRVTFADGRPIVADAEHQWLVHLHDPTAREPHQHDEILTTHQIARVIQSQPHLRVHIPATKPLQLPAPSLPIAAFTLGVLLAATDTNTTTVPSLTGEAIAHIESEGYVVKPIDNETHRVLMPSETAHPANPGDSVDCVICGECFTARTVHDQTCDPDCGARLAFRQRDTPTSTAATLADLLARIVGDTRRVPAAYLRADAQSRRDLLAGLTSGHQARRSLTLALTRTLPDGLAADIDELTATLGIVTPQQTEKSPHHTITEITPVPSVAVRCIEVDNPSHLYLAGRHFVPTHNSTLGMDLARACAIKQNKPAAVFSLEMSRQEITTRIISAQAGVDLGRMRSGRLDDRDWERVGAKADLIREAPLFIDDTPGLTMGAIRAQCRRLKQRHGLELVVIDYLQLLSPDSRANSRQEEVSLMSRQVKLLAKELQVPVIAMSQLNRGNENRSDPTPKISDLRESGAIEQDSDVVILIHREDMYDPDTPRVGEVDLILAKQRSAPTGTCILAAQLAYSRFVDLTNAS